jgi:NitT/TauT family transport system ATP-binding protein
MTGPPKIEFASVEKVFFGTTDDVKAVNKISFSIFPGEFISLLGPSGCGKTTVINLIAGFTEPTGGGLYIDGLAATRQNKFGMVFQSDASFPWMTVRENIEYGVDPANSYKRKGEELANYYVDLLGLNEFANSFPKELSGGMRKRVELGRAFASKPDILLLDEPFGSLDVLTKQEMQSLLHQIWEKERKTVVFVTHDVEEAIFMSNRVLVMTPRPGTIKKEFSVPFALPRTESLKLSQPFQDLRRMIVNALRTKQ